MKRLLCSVLVALGLFAAVNADATNYFMKPASKGGRDTYSGLYESDAWATLNRLNEPIATGKATLLPGDTVFIMGGIYEQPQNFYDTAPIMRGAEGNPIVIKAYGDSVAVFMWGHDSLETRTSYLDDRTFFYFGVGSDYITLDGWGKYWGGSGRDSLLIQLQGRRECRQAINIGGSASDLSVGMVVRGVEINGNFPTNELTDNLYSTADPVRAMTVGGLLRNGINVDWADMDTIESCYIHDIYYPMGPIAPGDSTLNAQSPGESIYIESSNRSYIANNTLTNANHALISLEPRTSTSQKPFGNKFINNKCSNSWGGGIYAINADYNLADGNIIVMPATTTTKTKGPIGFNGVGNTVRRNVLYNPYNWGGLDANATTGQKGTYNIDGLLVYNNTLFGNRMYDMHFLINPGYLYNRNNRIMNNIMYKGRPFNNPWLSERRGTILSLYLYYADNDHNWVEPDSPETLPSSTDFGNNRFYNNCMLKPGSTPDSTELYKRMAITYASSPAEGRVIKQWTIEEVEAMESCSFAGNISADPLLVSEQPDTVGVFTDWWHIPWDSPCVDAGAIVTDGNGLYVEDYYVALGYEGYGWDDLTYTGHAPDIGAYEYAGEDDLPAPYIVIQPYAFYFYGAVEDGEVDTTSVWVKNACLDTCEAATLSPVIIGDDRGVYTVVPLADSTLIAGDSIHIYLEFAPDTAAALLAKMILWDGGLDTIPIYGIGADTIPDCCAFGETEVIRGITALKEVDFGEVVALQAKLDTVYIANCAATTLEPTISIKTGTSFSIVSGGGAIEVAPYWGVEAIVIQFKPINYGALTDSLVVTGTDGCSGILLKGTGARAPSTRTVPVPPTEPIEE